METREQLHQRVRRNQHLQGRLRLATTRLADAEQERIWAIVAAHQAGLSIRQIAAATGLSRSRIHQFLQEDEAREILSWLSQRRSHDQPADRDTDPAPPPAQLHARIAEEVEVLRWGLDWLEWLDRGEQVIVNRRPDTEDTTEYVPFDQTRVCCVLARIGADLDLLARHGAEAEAAPSEQTADPRARHRHRLAEPAEQPQRGRTAKEQREALRQAFGLPHYEGDYADSFRHLRGTKPE